MGQASFTSGIALKVTLSLKARSWPDTLVLKSFDQPKQLHRLIVKFQEKTSEEAINVIKSRNFKWNQFREEWYGFGEKEELSQALGDSSVDIIEITE